MDQTIEFIIYVNDQQRSRDFYKKVLQKDPSLDVPGMTEFQLTSHTLLGIMPEKGIAKILTGMPDPGTGNGIPRCELYIFVNDPQDHYDRTVNAGGTGISPALARDWGHTVSYTADPDGHVIAFAKKNN